MRETKSTKAESNLRQWLKMLPPALTLAVIFGFLSSILKAENTAKSPPLMSDDASGKLAVVVDGKSVAPIVVFKDAPPLTRLAADELAYYIEKTSGAKPEILEGTPDPLPESAIWVGYQPVLKKLFPKVDFDFKHPGEIIIAANNKNLVIAGRDRWNPDHMTMKNKQGKTIDGVQLEYGTHNAVYTFMQDCLGVRWLWQGELGIDVIKRKTIAFEPFTYRYHPQVLSRGGLFAYTTFERGGADGLDKLTTKYWVRAQRLQLSELPAIGGHGPWKHWWERFYETHPEYFASQPNGTRGGGDKPFPDKKNVKMCQSNPDLAKQFLDDVAEQLKENPNLQVFNASPSDGWAKGHCICPKCKAWDHPKGKIRWPFSWQGFSHKYVSLSDRDITFANRLARGLKERFPDKDLYILMMAYGHSRPAPVGVVPDDNVIIGNVANFLLRSDVFDRGSTSGATHRKNYEDWGKVTKLNYWRPNTGSPVGWQWGLPDVPLTRTIDDMKFAATNGWMGIFVDYVREHWATQAPMYYLMAQLVWDPSQDGQAVLKDFYRRAYGPAAEEMEAYWTYLEKIREECYGDKYPGRADHDIVEFYNKERLDKAEELIDAAVKALGPEDKLYLQRVEFTKAGLDITRLNTECARLVRKINNNEDPGGQARAMVHANWKKLRALRDKYPTAMQWRHYFRGGDKSDGKPIKPKGAPPIWVP
ncbi:DUF4838 domain-containing protein [Verrucomicrobiota bacterium]